VRRFRKILTVFALALLLVVALAAGGLATSLFTAFGSGKAMSVKGPLINAKELPFCDVVLIDLERIDISRASQLALLPNPLERITINLAPEVEFNAGLLPRESVDPMILGFDTCIATLESNSWTVMHSALGEPWFTFGERIGFEASCTGTSISFDVAQASNSTLIISISDQDPPIQQITLDGEISFPNANAWIIGLAIISGTLIMLFVVLVVIYIVKSRKGTQV
jgi:hypothetical protein